MCPGWTCFLTAQSVELNEKVGLDVRNIKHKQKTLVVCTAMSSDELPWRVLTS